MELNKFLDIMSAPAIRLNGVSLYVTGSDLEVPLRFVETFSVGTDLECSFLGTGLELSSETDSVGSDSNLEGGVISKPSLGLVSVGLTIGFVKRVGLDEMFGSSLGVLMDCILDAMDEAILDELGLSILDELEGSGLDEVDVSTLDGRGRLASFKDVGLLSGRVALIRSCPNKCEDLNFEIF